MEAWEDLKRLLAEVERALSRLQAGGRARPASVVRDDLSGLYTREYLAHRLPGEMYRFRHFERPFSLVLARMDPAAFSDAGKWGKLFAALLRPVDVPVRYSDTDVLVLYPEASEEEAVERARALADGIALLGICRWSDLLISVASAGPAPDGREEALSAGAMLDDLEARLAPVSRLGREGSPPVEPPSGDSGWSPAGDPGIDPAWESRSGPSRESVAVPADTGGPNRAEPGEAPVAVGFAAGERLPVSFWYEGELRRIQAVLEKRAPDGAMLVLTDAGPYYLAERSSRWFARPYSR